MDAYKEYQKQYQAWNKEINEPYYYNTVNGEMQDWQKEGYIEVEHDVEAKGFGNKAKNLLKKIFA